MDVNDEPEAEELERPPIHEVDPFLTALVSFANNDVLREYSMTVFIGAGIVTGHLTSRRRWFEDYVDRFIPALKWDDEEASQAMRESFLSFGGADPATRTDEEKDRLDDPVHIHLSKARLLVGGTRIPTTGTFSWRGRLAAVEGFMLGEFGSADD